MRGQILIVEDEEILRESLVDFFRQENYLALSAETLSAARQAMAHHNFDLMILDMKLPDGSGLDLLAEISDPQACLVIVATAFPEVQTAVKALKLGAFDYINKPFDLDELQLLVERAMETRKLRGEVNTFRQREKQRNKRSWTRLEGGSVALKKLRQEVMLVAKADTTTTLILGESGVVRRSIIRVVAVKGHCLKLTVLPCRQPCWKMSFLAMKKGLILMQIVNRKDFLNSPIMELCF